MKYFFLIVILCAGVLASADPQPNLATVKVTTQSEGDQNSYLQVILAVDSRSYPIGWQATTATKEGFVPPIRSGPRLESLTNFAPKNGHCQSYISIRKVSPFRANGTFIYRHCRETRKRLLWRGVCLTWEQARMIDLIDPKLIPKVMPAEEVCNMDWRE